MRKQMQGNMQTSFWGEKRLTAGRGHAVQGDGQDAAVAMFPRLLEGIVPVTPSSLYVKMTIAVQPRDMG